MVVFSCCELLRRHYPEGMVMHAGVLIIVSVLLSACATAPTHVVPVVDERSGLMLRSASEPLLTWPSAPDTARYRYVGQLLGEQNFPQPQRSMGQRFFAWLVGLTSSRRRPDVLQRPQNGLVSSDERIFVSDVSRAAVFVFDGRQSAVQIWEMAAERTRFITPLGLLEDDKQGLLVADADLGYVVRLDAKGQPLGQFGADILQRPTGLARDPETGQIYVADSQAHVVQVFSSSGEWLATIGQHGEANGEFNAPTYLTWVADQLYVTDSLNSRVQVFDKQGVWQRTVGRRGLFLGDMPRPKGVAVDRHSNLYVVESYYDYLLVFNDKGEFLLPIGGTGNSVGQFYLPAGVWVDQEDRIYVADTFNGRIVIFQYLGDL